MNQDHQPTAPTKENFWNEILEKCPGEMKSFLAWIDQYKKRMNWDDLFRGPQKYNDLPLAMQFGIFLQYTVEVQHFHRYLFVPWHSKEFAASIRMWFFNEEYYSMIMNADVDASNHPDNFAIN